MDYYSNPMKTIQNTVSQNYHNTVKVSSKPYIHPSTEYLNVPEPENPSSRRTEFEDGAFKTLAHHHLVLILNLSIRPIRKLQKIQNPTNI